MSGEKDLDLKELDGVRNVLQAIPFDEVSTICDAYVKSVDACISTLCSLQIDEAELKQKLKDCKRQVQRLQSSATGLNSSLENLLKYVNTDDKKYQEKVKGIERGNLAPVKEYVKLVKEYLNQTRKHFEDFKTLCEETITINSKTELSIEAQKAITKKEKTRCQVYAATALGMSIVVVSAVGVFTAGAGTIAGLSITASGVIVGYYKAAKQLGILAERLQQIQEKMKLIQQDTNRLNDMVYNVELYLKQVEDSISMLECVTDKDMELSLTNKMKVLSISREGMDKGPVSTQEVDSTSTEEVSIIEEAEA